VASSRVGVRVPFVGAIGLELGYAVDGHAVRGDVGDVTTSVGDKTFSSQGWLKMEKKARFKTGQQWKEQVYFYQHLVISNIWWPALMECEQDRATFLGRMRA
jgi:hypothetical protein